jgi:hypothetical protein
MITPKLARLVRTTPLTKVAITASVATIAWSLAFLLFRYRGLPWLLPVHFRRDGFPKLAIQDLLARAAARVRADGAGVDARRGRCAAAHARTYR